MAGKMLCTEDSLSAYLSWDQRANMLAGNAIDLFNLDTRFKTSFQNRLKNFKSGMGAAKG
jgi:aminocarboxymuconate-semialdehyde decarboxylase